MRAAYQQVKRNAGAPGIDGMSVEELGPHLREEWQRIKEALLVERYEPQPVKRVEIPKPGGGVRQLGIPTVVDRLIQQALHQVMSRVFEPGFSESSYGFRPGRSAHDAVQKAREYVAGGKRWVVDMDLPSRFREELRAGVASLLMMGIEGERPGTAFQCLIRATQMGQGHAAVGPCLRVVRLQVRGGPCQVQRLFVALLVEAQRAQVGERAGEVRADPQGAQIRRLRLVEPAQVIERDAGPVRRRLAALFHPQVRPPSSSRLIPSFPGAPALRLACW